MSKDVKEQLQAWAAEGESGMQAALDEPAPAQRPPVTATPEKQDRPAADSS